METGEYRGFAGQFSRWLRAQLVIWRWPLLFSLLLHVCLFWPQSLQQRQSAASMGGAAPGLQARLRPAAVPATSVEQVPLRPAPPLLMPAMSSNPVASVAAPVFARAEPMATPPAPFVPHETGESVTAGPAASGLDAGAVRIYRLALARAIRVERLRPRLPDPSFQGALTIGVVISAAGQLRAVTVVRSSGSAAADAAVVAAVDEAARAAPLPLAMRGRDFVIELLVEIGTTLTAAADR